MKSLKLNEDLQALYDKFYKEKDLPEELFLTLTKFDPTYKGRGQMTDNKGKYTKWIIDRYLKGDIDESDFGHIKDALSRFEDERIKLDKKDINQYKTLEEIDDALDNSEFTANQLAKRNRKAKHAVDLDDEESATLVYEDNDWEVWVPHTYEASCKLGSGSNWCTASTSSDYYYNSYKDNYGGEYYININKHDPNEKYQFHFESNLFMDMDDYSIDIGDFLTKNKGLGEFYLNTFFNFSINNNKYSFDSKFIRANINWDSSDIIYPSRLDEEDIALTLSIGYLPNTMFDEIYSWYDDYANTYYEENYDIYKDIVSKNYSYEIEDVLEEEGFSEDIITRVLSGDFDIYADDADEENYTVCNIVDCCLLAYSECMNDRIADIVATSIREHILKGLHTDEFDDIECSRDKDGKLLVSFSDKFIEKIDEKRATVFFKILSNISSYYDDYDYEYDFQIEMPTTSWDLLEIMFKMKLYDDYSLDLNNWKMDNIEEQARYDVEYLGYDGEMFYDRLSNNIYMKFGQK